MAVRLVIGRAGTGKTALCVEEIRVAAARDPLGPPLLWITPEQATFSAERLLLTRAPGSPAAQPPPPRGSFRAQVLSFRRLALLIARQTGILPAGAQAARPMDEVARIILLEETVRRHRDELSVFAASADRPGFIHKLDATLRELRQQGHSGSSLRQIVDTGGGGAGRMDAVMQRKLLDLAILLDAWSEVVDQPDAWDFEALTHRAILAMKRAPLIVGDGGGAARVWVDAISAMSGLEIRMLAELGLCAREVTVTLLADPAAPALRDMRGPVDPAADTDLFARTHRLHRHLIDAFRRHGVTMATTLALRQQHRLEDAQLQLVEREMFDETPAAAAAAAPGPPSAEARPASAPARSRKRAAAQQPSLFDALEGLPPPVAIPAPTPAVTTVPRTGGMEIWESSDPETEVRIVSQAIRQLVISPAGPAPLRYRQIGVIVPELDDGGTGQGYQDAIRRIFAEHGIPHFIDARRKIGHHPLVELLRTAVAVVRTHFDRDEMLLLLKTQLLGISPEDVALLENYLLEHGIDHVPWDRAWTWVAPNQEEGDADDRLPQSAFLRLDRVNKIRARVWQMLETFITQMTASEVPEAASGARFPQALRALLKTLNAQGQLENWIKAARSSQQPGSAELAQVHQQVWREVERLLQLLEVVLSGRQRTLAEFERILSTALQSLTLGLIPPTVDQVLVSSLTRSRVPEMEIVFILGAVEGQFPKVVPEDPILSDAQRAIFNELAADPIGEGSDRQLLEMPFFDYVALTRARRHVVISCPLADRAGKALGCSRHVQRLRDLLGDALIQRSFDAQSRTHVDRISTVDDLLAGVARWARQSTSRLTGRTKEGVPEPDDALMPAVYNWLVTRAPMGIDIARRQIWSSISPRNAPKLSPELAAGFYPPGTALRLSISQLEQFAACPLQYFAYDTLGLRDRPVFQLDELSLGELQHRILERVYRRLMEGALAWPETSQPRTRALLMQEVDATIQELHAELAERTPGYDKLRLRLIRVLGIMVESDRRRALAGQLRPRAVELYFGRGDKPQHDQSGRLVSLPVLTIAGRVSPIHLSGKIDRMDQVPSGTEASVIDYKSATYKTLDLFRVLHGISLQLPAYALVLRDLALRTPIAAFYMPLGLRMQTVQHAGEAPDPASDEFYQQVRPRGLADADHAWKLDQALPAPGDAAGGKSLWYNFSFTQKGPPAKKSDLLTHEDFQLLLQFTRAKIQELGSDLAQGVIAPAPFRCGNDTPCNYCDFTSLCPHDQARDTFREVAKEKPAIVLEKMRCAIA